ncbi:putative integral membrane protein [Paenibacillus shirakamiensis]|uniref:Integral membrane protein n=1 Tax=Paenibacillus shirakamiensis TaxID=1265935 RepID=A0ABS4JJL9_9BACL|nr:lipopolysaccharide assembly protein LapA domain-containing protein [Paenibacillus shirakamiensis]MBP2001310.1 putative integral membrane protein [Paenibacillus shirakamiensis]
MKIQWSLIAALVFALITAVFAVINVKPVQVNLLFSTVSLPLILLIIGSTLLGGIIVGSFGLYRNYRLQRENQQLKLDLMQQTTVEELKATQSQSVPKDSLNNTTSEHID